MCSSGRAVIESQDWQDDDVFVVEVISDSDDEEVIVISSDSSPSSDEEGMKKQTRSKQMRSESPEKLPALTGGSEALERGQKLLPSNPQNQIGHLIPQPSVRAAI